MEQIRKIEIMQDIHAENDEIATQINKDLTTRGVYVINVMGAPGAGKTSSLINIIKSLEGLKAYVIEGDIESDIDTKTLLQLGVETMQINTGGACHLDSPMIKKATDSFEFDEKGILFIENIGNLVCPAEFVIGEHIKLLICTVTEGSDKPYKYPLAFEKADIILINKIDLKPYLDFDEKFFYEGVRALNKTVQVFEVSCRTGEGFKDVVEWITNKAIS